MAQYLPPGPEGDPVARDFSPRVVQYLTTVSEGTSFRIRSARELRALAQSLDAILAGDLLLAADT
eukprot:7539129-Lingulodinium_polyedra.AAC.1